MKFKVGDKWRTRDGYVATILEVTDSSLFPLRGIVDEAEYVISETWMNDGKARVSIEWGTDLITKISSVGDSTLDSLEYFREKMGW